MDVQLFDSVKGMGLIQVVLSIVLGIYGVSHLVKYWFARHYRLSGTERVDKLLMAVANFSLSTVNILLLVMFKA
ncbi:hypothetical protein [Mucilaginibacter polytrichastri]|uniref:Uncharacterized protein n=1 Tax=Mucilaginibacter polytrichastri TaxID=1302689 RepID=A0A1Q5ZXV3_9SPHI|nr:hypothetical protein [Mucilaginibacter polytrichastri]OKS86590.1 hypothetical protein RG47T_2046 [Mucilaginibacter polytrichastri]SFS80555.1 hypothetical protein SAMN04487890_104158 [Mucilaginibacter polytrichastri]